MADFYKLNDLDLPGKLVQEFNAAYGDNYIAAKYSGFRQIPQPVNGEWQHGWIGPDRNIHPEYVIGSDGKSGTRLHKRYFVSRRDQVDYLQEHGFTNVHAIGLPLIYVDKPDIERKEGSLLVMPVHSLSDTEENWNDEEYASYIESKTDSFSEIVLCLHSSDLKKGNWIPAFSKRNIRVVCGADPDDCNSYIRLAILFSRFEFVTTNDIGSHIAYASYFGARTSVAGPKPHFEKKDYARTEFYSNAPDVLEIVDQRYRTDFYKYEYPFLYTEPAQSVMHTQWAGFQLGEKEKKTPEELRLILGWTGTDRLVYKTKKLIRRLVS